MTHFHVIPHNMHDNCFLIHLTALFMLFLSSSLGFFFLKNIHQIVIYIETNTPHNDFKI